MASEVTIENTARIQLLKQLMEKDSLFFYYGNFTDSINDALIPLAESLIDKTEVSVVTKRRTFYILIECIQNVNRHHFSSTKETNLPKEIFWVEGMEDQFSIVSGNVMKTEDVSPLRSKIMKLNSLSPEALNAHYKTVLKETVLTSKGGAGLGLIEIVRKSSNKIRFKFQKLSEKLSFFAMETTIRKKEPSLTTPGFKGIENLNILNKVYKDYTFGLTLMGMCANNNLSEVESMVQYINMISSPQFFEKQESAESFHGLLVHMANISFEQPKFPNPHMLLQFEIKYDKRELIIGWLVPDEEVSECYTRLNAHVKSQPVNVMKLLNGIMDSQSPKIELEKFQMIDNNQLITVMISQGE